MPIFPAMREAKTAEPLCTASSTTCAPLSMRLLLTSACARRICWRAAARGRPPRQRYCEHRAAVRCAASASVGSIASPIRCQWISLRWRSQTAASMNVSGSFSPRRCLTWTTRSTRGNGGSDVGGGANRWISLRGAAMREAPVDPGLATRPSGSPAGATADPAGRGRGRGRCRGTGRFPAAQRSVACRGADLKIQRCSRPIGEHAGDRQVASLPAAVVRNLGATIF